MQLLLPGQQASPALPHSAQKLAVLQYVLAPAHEPSAQQGWPACAPQAWQTYEGLTNWQRVFGAVHEVLPQQGWPGPPHVPHAPFRQMPPWVSPQSLFAATHREDTQQPPAEQVLP